MEFHCRYFAFGSNMNPARVRQRGLEIVGVAGAVLDHHRLVFNKGANDPPGCGHANIEFAPGERVEGVLYELTDATQILRMDRFESAPVNYSRHVVEVRAGTHRLAAWTYVANPAVIDAGLRPDAGYMAHLLAGADWLSEAYLERLRRWPLARSG